jgi:glyoxylase-like metal-dependent hydrolase (beta-lactamase superfamily II)
VFHGTVHGTGARGAARRSRDPDRGTAIARVAVVSRVAPVGALMTVLAGSSLVAGAPSPTLMDSFAHAHELLDAARAAHGSLEGHSPLTVRCRGDYADLGHYLRPRELRAYRADGRATFDFAHDELRWRGALESNGERFDGSLWLGADRLASIEYGDATPQPDTARARVRARHRWAALVPSKLVVLAAAQRGSLRAARAELDGAAMDVVSFTDESGFQRALWLDAKTHLVRRVEELVADPLFGDQTEITDLGAYHSAAGLTLPGALRRHRLWFDEEVLTCEAGGDPVELTPAAPTAPPRAPELKVEALGAGLYAIRLEHLNNQTLFLEQADSVIAFDAPLDSATGELILDAIARTTHGKPVRALVLSHHHPDYVGGIRPFVARGAHLVTTPGNVEYLRQIATAERRLDPDAQSRARRTPQIDVVRGHLQLGAVELFDLGAASHHTDEYLVYWFPAARLLGDGDLVTLKPGADAPRGTDRALGLWKFIGEQKLAVERVITSWPIHGVERVIPVAALRRMTPTH